MRPYLYRLLVCCALLCLALPVGELRAAAAQEISVPLRVAAGTNLITLAREYCHTPEAWKTIARINRLDAPYLIYADREIEVPLSLLKLENLSLEVVTVSGAAMLQKSGGERVPLESGSRIAPGDTVQTGADAFVQLLYPNGAYVRIEPDSLVTLHYLLSLVDGKMKAEFQLVRGRINQRIDRKLDFNESMRTRTPMVITGIRGTEYRLKVGETQATTVETLQGEVSVQMAAHNLRLQADEGVQAQPGKGLGAPRKLPSPPALSSLAGVYRSLPAQIHLPAAPAIREFGLRLSSDEAGRTTVYEYRAPAGKPLVVEDLPDGRYFAFFTATDTQGFESREQGPKALTVRTMPPAPLVSAPRDNAIVWGENAQVSWLQSEQAVLYRAQLGRDARFSDLVDERRLADAAYLSPALAPGTYYFRVQALAADGFASDFSGTLRWEQREAPAMGGMESTSGEPPVLQWHPMGEGWRYDLQVATDKEFSGLLVDERGLTANAYTFPTKLDPGKYHIRLRGQADGEPPTPWTPTQTMTVKNEPRVLEGSLIGALLLGILLL